MTIAAAKLCVLLTFFNNTGTPPVEPQAQENTGAVVHLTVRQVAFARSGTNQWESDEIYANGPSIIRTTPIGKPLTVTVKEGIPSWEGKRKQISPDVPMDFTITVTCNEEKIFALHLVARIKNKQQEVMGRIDSTQYSIQGRPTFFVLPVPPNKEKESIVTLRITPAILTQKEATQHPASEPGNVLIDSTVFIPGEATQKKQ